MFNEFIIIISSVLVGWVLRDLRTQSIQKKIQEIKRKVLPNKSGVIEWTPPQTAEQQLEEEAKKNMYVNQN